MSQYSNVPKAGSYFTSSTSTNPSIKKSLYARGVNNPGVNSLMCGTDSVVEVSNTVSVEGATFNRVDKVTSISIDNNGKISMSNRTDRSQCPISIINDMLGDIPQINSCGKLGTRSVLNNRPVGAIKYKPGVGHGSSLARAYSLNKGYHPIDARVIAENMSKSGEVKLTEIKSVNRDADESISANVNRDVNPDTESVVKNLNPVRSVNPRVKIITKTVAENTKDTKKIPVTSTIAQSIQNSAKAQAQSGVNVKTQPTQSNVKAQAQTQSGVNVHVKNNVKADKNAIAQSNQSTKNTITQYTHNNTTPNHNVRFSSVAKSLIRPQLKANSIAPLSSATLTVKLSDVNLSDHIRVGLGSPTLANGGVWVESSEGYWWVKDHKVGPMKSTHKIVFQLREKFITINVDNHGYQVLNPGLSFIPVVEANSDSTITATYTVGK